MQVVSITTQGDISDIVLDFTDEVLEETPAESCMTTARVSGDPQVYIQSLADDFRRNNPRLFPAPEPEVSDQMMEGDGDGLQ